jgi:hypothetical protein
VGRNRPAEAMPFDGMVRQISIIYMVNLFANKRVLTEQINRLCARCCTQHLTHTHSGKRHVEPTIGWLHVLRSLDSKMSVIVSVLTLASQIAGFGRPMCLSLGLIRLLLDENCTTNSYLQFPFHLHSRLPYHEHYLSVPSSLS